MNKLSNNIKDIIIQTATPYGIGNGFYLLDYKLIIAYLSLMKGAKDVVISGKHVPKTMAKVIFTDPVLGLVFIKAPESILLPGIKFAPMETCREGDKLKLVTQFYKQGLTMDIVNLEKKSISINDIDLLQYTGKIDCMNKGGLLLDENDKLVGIDSYKFSKDKKQQYALPADLLKQTLDEYIALGYKPALRCPSCKQIIILKSIENGNCPNCKAGISETIISGLKYAPTPIGKKVEEIISRLNYEVVISRIGLNSWEIEEGSTEIRVRHDIENNFIIADAVLCKIPMKNKSSIYEYLLKENNYLKGLSFKLQAENIILSMAHISGNDFHVPSASRQFKELFNKADDYDDILIEMGAVPLNGED